MSAPQVPAGSPIRGRLDQFRSSDRHLLFRWAPRIPRRHLVQRSPQIRVPRDAQRHLQGWVIHGGVVGLHHHRPLRKRGSVIVLVVRFRTKREHVFRRGKIDGRGSGVGEIPRQHVRRIHVWRHGKRHMVGIRGAPRCAARHGAEHGFIIRVVYVLRLHRHMRLHGRREMGGSIRGVAGDRSLMPYVRDVTVKRHVLVVVQRLRGRHRGREGRARRGIIFRRVQGRTHRGVPIGGVRSMLNDRGLDGREGKVGLVRPSGVKDGIIVQIERINVVRDLRIGVGGHGERIHLGGLLQGIVPQAHVPVGIMGYRDRRRRMYLRRELGRPFTGLDGSPVSSSLAVPISRRITRVSSMLVFRTRRWT